MMAYNIEHVRKSRSCNYVSFAVRLDTGKVVHGSYDLDEANVILRDWWLTGDYDIAQTIHKSIANEMKSIQTQTKQAIYNHYSCR